LGTQPVGERESTCGNNQENFNLRDNESNPDFGYEKTIAILKVATGDLGFRPKC
jgi:hypothetical protein